MRVTRDPKPHSPSDDHAVSRPFESRPEQPRFKHSGLLVKLGIATILLTGLLLILANAGLFGAAQIARGEQSARVSRSESVLTDSHPLSAYTTFFTSSPTANPSAQLTPITIPSPQATPTISPSLPPSPSPSPTNRPTAKPTIKPTPKPTPAPTPDANGIVWYNGFADPRTIKPVTVPDPESMTVLVNKYRQLPDGYAPPLVKAAHSADQSIHPTANEAWNQLHLACLEQTGSSLYLVSGYRSQSTQASLFNKSLAEKGVAHTVAYYAYPGRSEHQLGLGFDLGTTDKPYKTSGFATSAAGRWMAAHAHEHGFILRYPSGKSAITGYAYEAWHFRYVGVAAATAIREKGIALDE